MAARSAADAVAFAASAVHPLRARALRSVLRALASFMLVQLITTTATASPRQQELAVRERAASAVWCVHVCCIAGAG
eukprot:7381863-Prymnesium_polylepis.1